MSSTASRDVLLTSLACPVLRRQASVIAITCRRSSRPVSPRCSTTPTSATQPRTRSKSPWSTLSRQAHGCFALEFGRGRTLSNRPSFRLVFVFWSSVLNRTASWLWSRDRFLATCSYFCNQVPWKDREDCASGNGYLRSAIAQVRISISRVLE